MAEILAPSCSLSYGIISGLNPVKRTDMAFLEIPTEDFSKSSFLFLAGSSGYNHIAFFCVSNSARYFCDAGVVSLAKALPKLILDAQGDRVTVYENVGLDLGQFQDTWFSAPVSSLDRATVGISKKNMLAIWPCCTLY
jgi:hypothetical protein